MDLNTGDYTNYPEYWAQIHSGSLGEVKYAIAGTERIVLWRPACGYPPQGCDADDNQPWRLAEDEGEAFALIFLNAYRHAAPELAGVTWRNLMINPTRKMHGYDLDVKLIKMTRHANVKFREGRPETVRYYDPAINDFRTADAAVAPVREWQGWLFKAETCHSLDPNPEGNGVKMQGYEIFSDYYKDWALHSLPYHTFAIVANPHERRYELKFNDKMPAYVRNAVKETYGQIRFVPNAVTYPREYEGELEAWRCGDMRNVMIQKDRLPLAAWQQGAAPDNFHNAWNHVLEG